MENILSLHVMAQRLTFLEIPRILTLSLNLMENLQKALTKSTSMRSFPFWIKNLLI